jgi:hypothetical protein
MKVVLVRAICPVEPLVLDTLWAVILGEDVVVPHGSMEVVRVVVMVYSQILGCHVELQVVVDGRVAEVSLR